MKKFALLAILLLVTLGCAHTKQPMATAMLQPSVGSTAHGSVHFTQLADGTVDVQIDLTGVPPGVHGFHVHDKGDCGDNGMAAGGHFNPMNMPHAAPDAASHHAGDFGNVTAEANGEVHTKFNTHSITLGTGTNSAIGHAVILHANPDDLTTQPTGNAGARIACGIVNMADANMPGMAH
ncbi:MAG: superoxide dismutase family protein [Thermoanaerobaculia bacterium]